MAFIKLPHNARQSSIGLNECIWCLGFGRLFDQVEILMDFSSPLTDEAGGGMGGGGGGGCAAQPGPARGRLQAAGGVT